jgi:hypothetical protein
VVDPGVGSARAAVAIETARSIFIGPDNGLFCAALARDSMRRAVCLTNPAYHLHPVSATFHGRDVFAPVAAHLAAGASFDDLGEPITELVSLDMPRPVPRGDELEVHVLYADRFGNLITDLRAEEYARWRGDRADREVCFTIGATQIVGLRRTYADAEKDEPVACIGSGGRLEIAVREGDAGERFRGISTVILRWARAG